MEPSTIDSDWCGEFCSEAEEHLEAIDRYLLCIAGDPTDSEALNAIYRGYHTLKGGASMLGLTAMERLAHEAENLLNLAREGEVLLRGRALDLTFECTDAFKLQLDYLRNWLANRGELACDPRLPTFSNELRAFVNSHSRTALPLREDEAPIIAPAWESPAALPEKQTVRVEKDRLDRLIERIGELMAVQAQAEQTFDEQARSQAFAAMNTISRDIRDLGLSLRMIPLQGLFQKMARLVRDLSRKLQKPVELKLSGEETELDSTIVDRLRDPLMHMVCNAIDHGLESQDEREAAGKPAEGTVHLQAFHRSGSVYLELSDDGKGLDRDRILRKGIEKGLASEDRPLRDSEIYELIFEPGFSTAQAVTDISGRGVGMDVVRKNVELLQGRIRIRTTLGRGTTFAIQLPLKLATWEGLLVSFGNTLFVLPSSSVIETICPQPQDWRFDTEQVRVRGETVPLLRLHHLCEEREHPGPEWLVHVEDRGNNYAIPIDEFMGKQQVVVTSLTPPTQPVDGLAGTTILNSGRIARILDIPSLARRHRQPDRCSH